MEMRQLLKAESVLRGRKYVLNLFVLAVIDSACSSHEPSHEPNLLLITVDTIRADHCSVYGYPRHTTPTLERVASEGVLFDTAYAPTATTAPSHATIFTSHYPLSHGVVKNGNRLESEATTLAEVLSARGYETGAVVSSFALDATFGLNQGFTFYDDEFDGEGSFEARQWEGHSVPGTFDQDATETTREAEEWLRRHESDSPFFLWVHYFDPHDPYLPREPFDTLFDEGRAESDDLGRIVAYYDAEIRETDDAIGNLLESLESLGLAKDTLLVITGDHGEGLMQHGHMAHGLQIYEEAVRVPLIFRFPGRLDRDQRVMTPVALIDLMPTVLDLLGLRSDRLDLQGKSLTEMIQGTVKAAEQRDVYFQRRFYDVSRVGDFEVRGEKFGIRSGDWKYIEAKEEGSYELFDLSRDPREETNLYHEQRTVADRLSRRLEAWRRRFPALDPAEISTEDMRRLKSLGYVP